MAKTAVEWLIDQLEKYELYSKISFQCLKEIEQAKEMDKEQKKDAWEDGVRSDNGFFGTFEQYYNETFGGDNNGEITTMEGDNNIPDNNMTGENNTSTTGNLSGNIWGGDTTSTTWGGDTSNNKIYDSNTWMFRRKMVDENVNRIKAAKQIWDKETMAEYVNKIEAEKQIWDKTVNWDIMNKHTRVND